MSAESGHSRAHSPTAYDKAVYHGLRSMLYYDALADVKSTRQAMEGSSVIFTIATDLSVATTALNESTDVTAVDAVGNILSISEVGTAGDVVRRATYQDRTPLLISICRREDACNTESGDRHKATEATEAT